MLLTDPATDKRFWELVREFSEKLDELARTKGGDYNRLADFLDYVPQGSPANFSMLWKHMLRLLNLQLQPGAPNHETFEQTLFDIANYVRYHWAILQIERENGGIMPLRTSPGLVQNFTAAAPAEKWDATIASAVQHADNDKACPQCGQLDRTICGCPGKIHR